MGWTLAQTTQPVTWPVVVPWLLTAVFGITTIIFASLNYRRTHFGAVKLVRSEVYRMQSEGLGRGLAHSPRTGVSMLWNPNVQVATDGLGHRSR